MKTPPPTFFRESASASIPWASAVLPAARRLEEARAGRVGAGAFLAALPAEPPGSPLHPLVHRDVGGGPVAAAGRHRDLILGALVRADLFDYVLYVHGSALIRSFRYAGRVATP